MLGPIRGCRPCAGARSCLRSWRQHREVVCPAAVCLCTFVSSCLCPTVTRSWARISRTSPPNQARNTGRRPPPILGPSRHAIKAFVAEFVANYACATGGMKAMEGRMGPWQMPQRSPSLSPSPIKVGRMDLVEEIFNILQPRLEIPTAVARVRLQVCNHTASLCLCACVFAVSLGLYCATSLGRLAAGGCGDICWCAGCGGRTSCGNLGAWNSARCPTARKAPWQNAALQCNPPKNCRGARAACERAWPLSQAPQPLGTWHEGEGAVLLGRVDRAEPKEVNRVRIRRAL